RSDARRGAAARHDAVPVDARRAHDRGSVCNRAALRVVAASRMGTRMTALRIALAVVLAAGAVFAVLLAGDVLSVRSALADGDKVYAETPSRASWDAHARIGNVAQT